MILRRLVVSATSNSNLTRSKPLSASVTRLLSSSPYRNTPPQQHSGEEKLARLTHKDWLAPNEVLKIFENVKDPTFLIPAYHHYSKRNDYQPTEPLYSLLINKLGHAKMFDEIEHLIKTLTLEDKRCRFSEDFFYNLMKVYGNSAGRINKAIETLFAMPSFGCWPSAKSFNFILNLLVKAKLFDEIHKIFVSAPHLGVEIDGCCLNILIKGLCESKNLDAALQLLDEFPKLKSRPNVMTFSPLLRGFCNKGEFGEAFRLLERMEKEGIEPDAITFNILISGLRRKGRVEEGVEILKMMEVRGCQPNSGTYQEVLYGLLDKKRNSEAGEMMRKMVSWGMRPSFLSYKKLVLGLCETKSVAEVDWVLRQMVSHGFVPKTGMWWKVVGCVVVKNSDSQADLDLITHCEETHE